MPSLQNRARIGRTQASRYETSNFDDDDSDGLSSRSSSKGSSSSKKSNPPRNPVRPGPKLPRGFARSATFGGHASGHEVKNARPDQLGDITPPAYDRRRSLDGDSGDLKKKERFATAPAAADEDNRPRRRSADSMASTPRRGSQDSSPKRPVNIFSSLQTFAERIQNEVSDAISNSPVFGSAPDAFLKELSQHALPKTFEKNERLCVRGFLGESLIVILNGSVGVSNNANADDEVAILGNMDYWGEPNILGLSTKWDATLIAKETTHTSELTRDDFLNVLFKWPEELKKYEELAIPHKHCLDHGTLHHCLELFTGLSHAALVGIDAAMMRRMYFPGQEILKQGAPGDSMVILVRGQCDVEFDGVTVRQAWRGSCAQVARSRRNNAAARMPRPSKFSAINDLEFLGMHKQVSDGDREDATCEDEELENIPSVSDIDEEEDEDEDDVEAPWDPLAMADKEADEPACFGELCLLGMQKVRTASIIAYSICQVRILHRHCFTRALEENKQSLDGATMQAFVKKRYQGTALVKHAPSLATLKEVAIFKEVGCGEAFLQYLTDRLEDRLFLGGQRIIDENVADDCSMYILGEGTAQVLIGGVQVGTLNSGAVFGELVLLGLALKRASTIVAEEVCYTQVLKQQHVVQAMQLFPDERQKVLMIALKKSHTGAECIKKPDGSFDWKASSVNVVVKALQLNKMFDQVTESFVEDLSNASVDRIYMPGEFIIQEGAEGDSLFIMVSGQAKVMVNEGRKMDAPRGSEDSQNQVKTLIGMLKAGSISGELCMLGISRTRKATVEAETICVMWEISHEKAMPVIEAHPECRGQFLQSVCNHLEHTVGACIDSSTLFKNFSRKFRMLIGLYCERYAYFPGQAIFREGTAGEGLYILNYGEGVLERQGFLVKTCLAGAHFNSTIMLGQHKVCFCTLVCLATSHVVVITRASYVQAIEQYPADQAAKDIKKQEEADREAFRTSTLRLCSRGGIWNKSQKATIFERIAVKGKTTDKEVLETAIKRWKTYAFTSSRHRRKEQDRKQRNLEWVKKQRVAVAHRQSSTPAKSAVHDEVEELEASSSSFNPQTKARKYTRLSSLYLRSGQEWQSLVPIPKSTRQRSIWESQHSTSQFSAPRTPRDGRRPVTTGLPMMEGFSGAIWPNGGDRRTEAFSWDACDALGL